MPEYTTIKTSELVDIKNQLVHIYENFERFADMAEAVFLTADDVVAKELSAFWEAKNEIIKRLDCIDDQLGERLKYIELDDYVTRTETTSDVQPMVSAAHELMSDTTFRSEVRDIFRDLFKDSFVVEKTYYQVNKETGKLDECFEYRMNVADILEDISISLAILSGRR